MIIALAGRRVDAPDSKSVRFPSTPENLETVRKRILDLLQTKDASALVSSAACGADLLALSAADTLGVRRIVVLPFERSKIRSFHTSPQHARRESGLGTTSLFLGYNSGDRPPVFAAQ
jgi:hypothetical protein